MAVNDFDINELQDRVKKVIDSLPPRVGAMVVQFSKQRFRKQGWQGASFVRWRPRKATAARNEGRAILVDSGALRNSIRVLNASTTSVTVAVTGAAQDYAATHNEGFKGSVTVKQHTKRKRKKGKLSKIILTIPQHTRKMNIPQRQFIGESQTLDRNLSKMIEKELLKAFK